MVAFDTEYVHTLPLCVSLLATYVCVSTLPENRQVTLAVYGRRNEDYVQVHEVVLYKNVHEIRQLDQPTFLDHPLLFRT